MKDLLFLVGKLSEIEKKSILVAFLDSLGATDLSYDIVESTDVKTGLLNYYHGFVFVNIGESDRVRRFIYKGRTFNKAFFQILYNYDLGSTANPKSLSKLIDCTIGIEEECSEGIESNKFIRIDRYYGEDFLSSLNDLVKFSDRRTITIVNRNDDLHQITSLLNYIQSNSQYDRFYIVGDKERKELKRLIGQRVHFIDIKNIDLVASAIKDSVAVFSDIVSANEDKSLVEIAKLSLTQYFFTNEFDEAINVLSSSRNDSKSLNEARYKILHAKGAVYHANEIRKIFQENMNPSVGINIPGSVIRGGVNVAMHHAKFLLDKGYNVTLLSDSIKDNEINVLIDSREIPVVAKPKSDIECHFTKLVATLWNTHKFVSGYHKAKSRYYLVQGFETDFSPHGSLHKKEANSTYFDDNIRYITISKWCKKWLETSYGRKGVRYAPNGLDSSIFPFSVRKPLEGRRMIVLIEGNSEEPFRGIDEAFEIADLLDRDIFEIHYLSYVDSMKSWYNPDRTYFTVPYKEVGSIYGSCDILLKCSTLESFSYPPLEMMSTGGVCVIAENDGNAIYAQSGINCLTYKSGDITTAVNHINELYSKPDLRNTIISGGGTTAKGYSWDSIKSQVIDLYK